MQEGADEPPLVMCLLDNRGIGCSSCPAAKCDYSTAIMASDAAKVLVRRPPTLMHACHARRCQGPAAPLACTAHSPAHASAHTCKLCMHSASTRQRSPALTHACSAHRCHGRGCCLPPANALAMHTTGCMSSMQDQVRMQDELGWQSAHVVGFSMGGMVAAKFCALWPQRACSLSIISATRGGWDTLPRSWRAWKYVLRLARDKSPRTRACLDLKFHFTDRTLKQCAFPQLLACTHLANCMHVSQMAQCTC
jgi:pimeloyl-ACP methyl ester carboxylesterase